MDSLPQDRLPFQGRDRRDRTHELSLERADQSGHRLASLRLGEHGQGNFPGPEPEDSPRRSISGRFRRPSRPMWPATAPCRRRLRRRSPSSASKRSEPATTNASDQFQRQGGKGADQSWRRRLQEPQGVRPLGPSGGPPRPRRSCRPRGGAQGPAQGPGGARPQARRGGRSAEDRRHRGASARSLWGISSISSARRMRGRRARSTSASRPTD